MDHQAHVVVRVQCAHLWIHKEYEVSQEILEEVSQNASGFENALGNDGSHLVVVLI